MGKRLQTSSSIIRTSRLKAIAEILTTQYITSQSELSAELTRQGYPTTQATLSRDLKTLKASKVATTNGKYRYFVGDLDAAHISGGGFSASINPIISVHVTGNLAVIKTRNGYAPGLAYDIDMLESDIVLGTIPGTDTVFVALKEHSSRQEITNLFCSLLYPTGGPEQIFW